MALLKMDLKLGILKILCRFFIFLTTFEQATTSSCEIKNYVNNCKYTVRCNATAGTVNNPGCNSEPYVTFFMTHSNHVFLSTANFASTNFDSRVREIWGVSNVWKTIDSHAFKYYSKSLRLNLSNNKISSINAEAFFSLPYMQFLNLSNNEIQSFNAKSFMITGSHTSNLQELDLSYNKLQYLGSELNEVPKLTTIYLNNNCLSSFDDDTFMNLKSLTDLYLQNNVLTNLNMSLIHLKNLRKLDISNNKLIRLSGSEMNRLVGLVEFNISHNELTFVESNCFNQAFGLNIVDFSYNDISTVIENTMFINNNKLEYLNFFNNKIDSLDENVFAHCHLNYLNLTGNKITGVIKKRSFSNLTNITRLDLSQQRIAGIKANAFNDMNNLFYLNLTRNNISLIEILSFSNANNITILDISFNNLAIIDFIKNSLPNLTDLYLNNNKITVVPKFIFENQTQMRILDLSMNNIYIIDEYSLPLRKLQYLHILGNKLNRTVRPNVYSPAKFLRFLDLSSFNISKIESLAFVDLPVLAKLNLSNNYIENMEEDSLKGVDNLFSLDISHNKLTDLQLNISQLINLKALYLSDNKLTNLSAFPSSACNITYLDLNSNFIRNLSHIKNSVFPNLTVLFLDKNKIKQFNNPNTNSLISLIDLSLSFNEISNINLSYFKDLLSVDLSYNNLTYINRTFLEKNVYLQALDISNNRITELPPGTFQYMKNLKLLNLSSNLLTKLRYGSLKGLHKTEILDLSRNKMAQLDVDIFHECDELRTLIIDYNSLKTFDVERLILISLRKLRTLSIGGNPISCREIVHNIKSANTTFYAIRQVEVTSIDKIYHEDNVHGIQCGDESQIVLSTAKPPTSQNSNEYIALNTTGVPKTLSTDTKQDSMPTITSISLMLVLCSLLIIVLIICGLLAYFKLYKNHIFVVNRNSNIPLRNSIDMTGSEFQSDLLG